MKRPLAVINCSSASAPFLNRLAGENRVVITATKSGDEQNFAHFGQYLAAAIADGDADVDKDGQVSLLEAYLTACRNLDEFYKQEARLPGEHALLDDNGDGLGTPAAWFRGVRATQRAKAGRARRHAGPSISSVTAIAKSSCRQKSASDAMSWSWRSPSLRDEKPKLKEDEYYDAAREADGRAREVV